MLSASDWQERPPRHLRGTDRTQDRPGLASAVNRISHQGKLYGRRAGALVVEFELDALAAGDVLDRHLAERRRLVASQARKIDDGEALGIIGRDYRYARVGSPSGVDFMQSAMFAKPILRSSSTTQSAVTSVRSARLVLAFSIASAMSSFVKFWRPISRAVLARRRAEAVDSRAIECRPSAKSGTLRCL